MRTNIEIDDDLIERARGATGLKTKRAVVEEGLRTLIRLHDQGAIWAVARKPAGALGLTSVPSDFDDPLPDELRALFDGR